MLLDFWVWVMVAWLGDLLRIWFTGQETRRDNRLASWTSVSSSWIALGRQVSRELDISAESMDTSGRPGASESSKNVNG